MYVSISTTHEPATDLGFLLMKHPERVHEVDLAFGKAIVFYPEASVGRCEAVLVLDIDPVGLVRGRGAGDGILDAYVNDRPYAASSLLSVALNRVFRTAMTATSRDRPELAATDIPLVIHVTPLLAPGGERMVRSLFEPLGWEVSFEAVAGPDGPSRYASVTLQASKRLSDALTHLYVLIPVLDDEKHYWVGDAEVEKLVSDERRNGHATRDPGFLPDRADRRDGLGQEHLRETVVPHDRDRLFRFGAWSRQ